MKKEDSYEDSKGPKRPNFLRRTRVPFSPRNSTDSEAPSTESTQKFTRRGQNKLKSRKETKPAGKETQNSAGNSEVEKESAGNRKTPSLNGSGTRSERPTRNFVRRRLGGVNATSTTQIPPSSPPSSTLSSSSLPTSSTRRPYRIASRRRPAPSSSTTTEATTLSEEYLQEVEENDAVVEDTTLPERPSPKTVKLQRRPFILKDEEDQNPSATNEEKRKKQKSSGEDGKRQSKKYSSTFKQNQLDEVLRKASSQEDYDFTTEGKLTTVEDYSAETALAIAAHTLLSAPPPIVPNYDDDKPKRKSTQTTYEYKFTSPAYTEPYTLEESTKISSDDDFSVKTTPKITYQSVSTPLSTTAFSKTPDFSQYPSSTLVFPRSRPTAPGFSITTDFGPSTASIFTSDKIPIPVEDYNLSPSYSSVTHEPSYFTREYLLESPVTKTYDEEYQYLTVTPQTTTKKPRRTVIRKISTTQSPTEPPYVPLITTPKPRRASRKPFEKIPRKVPVPKVPVDKVSVSKVPFDKVSKPVKYQPIENYDYYDDSHEKMASKYDEGTKVILNSKGIIECLDIGNFPSPNSCKKFISCARLENGSLLGWEYICPKGLSFDPVGGICNWSAGLGCDEKDM